VYDAVIDSLNLREQRIKWFTLPLLNLKSASTKSASGSSNIA
jgi:hypothetical protein